ncbi:uncharacterized protein LOC132984246 [Labrus mixtus]|uniref:uncharacterized protein LOC132984246 n=1 Tax=Labrus mixtus TaxID=508554 RepID=UPI0029BFE2FB|nr:uncharacterized protein LOC132984246 [Labrus mixtus]
MLPECSRDSRMTPAVVLVLLAVLGTTCSAHATNIAISGKVEQSSLYGKGVPERAIDGNRASKWGDGSCTHTNDDLSPWWRLDLQTQYKITSVTITNRRDCCHDRINGAEIRIGDSLDDNGKNNPICAKISSIAAGASKTFQCNDMEGRYVTIVIPNKKQYLTLCEVEVTGETTGKTRAIATNIAISGKVEQSSLYGKGVPERAIDGNRASKWGDGSCTHTNDDLSPWWRLDLQTQYKITSVTITNRRDCCHDRINGAEIRIGDSLDDNGKNNPICAKISSIAAGASKTFQCNDMEGRYVTIVIPNKKQYLTLCEVEVTGETTGKTRAIATNIAISGKVEQSSLYGKGVPERAIDGNRASKWGDGSCTHTNDDLSPWWRLDLQTQYKITSVTITNRRDCCHDRINGAEIRIGDSLDDNGKNNPICAKISSIAAGASKTFQCNDMEGRYVTIVIPNKKQYLTLCEVEVTGETTGKTRAIATNIAISGKVEQSSLYGKGVPERAIDGNRASKWGDGSCTHTNDDLSPWWRLDLQTQYKITSVTITNRRDCCHDRINGAEIRIGDSLDDNGKNNPICAKISSIAAGASKTFQCNDMEGRYVTIVIPNKKQYLTLCEVEVTGIETEEESEEYVCN